MDIGIGSVIWKFDDNHRVYAKPESGRLYGEIIYRAHWVKRIVVSETSRSWITNYHEKVSKRGPRRGWAMTPQEVDDDVYLHDHRGPISRAVGNITSAETLRKVAQCVGYKP